VEVEVAAAATDGERGRCVLGPGAAGHALHHFRHSPEALEELTPMEPTPYAPPNARVRDLQPQAGGPLPDWLAVIIGLAANKFLTMLLADELSLVFSETASGEPAFVTRLALILDLVLSFGGELFSFWMTLRLCRSGSLRVVSVLAVLSWILTLGDRWILGSYPWPLWYESALLCVAPSALLSLYVLKRREGLSP
jgi:hypothetical protein